MEQKPSVVRIARIGITCKCFLANRLIAFLRLNDCLRQKLGNYKKNGQGQKDCRYVPINGIHLRSSSVSDAVITLAQADGCDVIDLFSCGSATCKSAATERGLEPDESFCIGERRAFPDLAIEVIVTRGGIDKLEVYQGLQVAEVWFYQNEKFSLYRLKSEGFGYDAMPRSQFFPHLDIDLMAEHIEPNREPEMVRAWRKLVNS